MRYFGMKPAKTQCFLNGNVVLVWSQRHSQDERRIFTRNELGILSASQMQSNKKWLGLSLLLHSDFQDVQRTMKSKEIT